MNYFPPSPIDLSGKIVLLTGAGREPVRSLAVALARYGARLSLNDFTPQNLEETAALVRAAGGKAACHIADPAKGLAARMLFDEVLDTWEGLDALVLYPRAEPTTSILRLDEWDWQRTLEANLSAPFLLMQTTGAWMRAEGRSGLFINLISNAASDAPDPRRFAFQTTQAGLATLTRSAAPDLMAYNIRTYGFTLGELPDPDNLAEQVLPLFHPECQEPAGSIWTVAQRRREG
jgi:NAD(P)-dependent dehydrogenase (short-subunit alcohol dehydrogenase family)